MNPEERKALRKSKIAARNALSPEERDQLSEQLVKQILASEEFRNAKTVMIYKGIKGEVRLEALEKSPEAQGKRLVYPLVISKTEMIALLPESEESWVEGYQGITEPLREKSTEIPPEEIDMMICPCTSFDEQGGRMGMGGGFYDRYLVKCPDAIVAAVAFECQKSESVMAEPWDKPMQIVYTEEKTYRF